MAIFMAKTTSRWLGCSRLDRPTWKVSSGSYHTTMHGRVCLRTILVHSRHLSRVPEMAIFMDKWLFLGQNTGRWVPPANCLMCHITSHYMAKHVSGPFVPSQCTLIALEGGLNKHAPKSSCYLRVVPVRWVPSWNCLMSHITSHCMATEWIADLVLKEYSYICYSILKQAKICESTINVQNTHNSLIK